MLNTIEASLNEDLGGGKTIETQGATIEGTTVKSRSIGRLNSFIHFYFLSNKRLFVFSILTYIFDLLLFISLSLYLLTNRTILTPVEESSIIQRVLIVTTSTASSSSSTTTTLQTTTTPFNLTNSTNTILVAKRSIFTSVNNNTTPIKYELKQSYLTVEIIAIFVFFICFILNNLIKLQFKYHRLALHKNKYRYRYNYTPTGDEDDEDGDDDEGDNSNRVSKLHNYSFTTSSSSYYSSSMTSHHTNNKYKRYLKMILGKFSRYLLYMYYGYQYCENTFLTEIFTIQLNSTNDENSDENSINSDSIKINILLTVIILIATILRVVIYYLKIYLTNDDVKQQEQQHKEQQQQHKTPSNYCFLFLFIGFNLAFFHLFTFKVALQLILSISIVLLIKCLIDFRQFKSAIFQIFIFSFCLNNYFRIYLTSNFNLVIFLCFLLTFYYRLSTINNNNNSDSTQTCLELLNKKFFCKNLKLHKLYILVTIGIKLVLLVVIISILITKYKSYYFSLIILLPLVSLLSIIWLMFNTLNVINLWLVMNKISECYKIAFDNAGLNTKRGGDADDDVDATTFHDVVASTTEPTKRFNFRSLCSKLCKSKLPVKLKVLNRIMAYKNIRHLATISFYIGCICFIQTLLLIIFVININSLLILNLFLIIICVNLFWLNLIYELSSLISGTSIIYALISPIDEAVNILPPSSTSSTSLPTYQNTYYQPSSFYKQQQQDFNLINKRSTYIFNKLYKFINYYLIENFSCDYLNASYSRLVLETKLRSFFSKVTLDGPRYNTYILYYCGLTMKTMNNQQQVCNMVLQDGTQFTIDDIVNVWKDIHCKPQQPPPQHRHKNNKVKNSIKYKNIQNKADTTDSDDQLYNASVSTHPNGNETVVTFESSDSAGNSSNGAASSRLILVFDAENTDLLLNYVTKNLTQKNLFVALQTSLYFNRKDNNAEEANRKVAAKPIGRFTIDWINYSCKSSSLTSEHIIDQASRSIEHHNLDDDDDDDAFSDDYERIFNPQRPQLNEENDNDSDDMHKNNNINEMQTLKVRRRRRRGKRVKTKNLKLNEYYECKYALSKYWTAYNFESSDLQEDMKQFWKTNYPKVLQPMLKLINLSLFSLRFNCFKEVYIYFKWLKYKILPLPKEYDTGHGFKLVSS